MTYSTYKETAKKLNEIRTKYTSAGDMIFRCAVYTLFEEGSRNIKKLLADTERIHKYQRNIGIPAQDEQLTEAILCCAEEMKDIHTLNLVLYMAYEGIFFPVPHEIYRQEAPIPYKRLREITDDLLSGIAEDYGCISDSDHLQRLKTDGLTEAEIRYFGYEYLLDLEEEIEDDEG